MQDAQNETQRDARYPISRWYVRPIAGRAAHWLSETRVRPSWLTASGAVLAAGAVGILCIHPNLPFLAAIPVWLAWFCDRADGMLARQQGTASAWGAWFDANVDELVDLALQVAVAVALLQQGYVSWPWVLLVAFLTGKYLFMYGLAVEESDKSVNEIARGQAPPLNGVGKVLRDVYHLPGNCDVRVHWLMAMLLLDQLALELAAVAFYYNLRWIVRYAILWRRLGKEG